ncbi:MAG: DUF4296 domain-containing protein [Rikenellaceae bacterium]
MKRFFYLYIMLPMVAFVGCSRHKIIPDGELAQIFSDAFLVNAYVLINNPNLDSLNVYEPIFEKYGYTTEDVQYTIGNFSKRKSARLGDVVERSIAILETKGGEFDREVKIIDEVSTIARRLQTRELFYKDEILIASKRDTIKGWITIPDIKPGDYTLSFDYLIDSLDENHGTYRTRSWFETGEKVSKLDQDKHDDITSYLQRNKVMTHTRNFEVEREYMNLSIELIDLMKKEKQPHVKLRDIRVVYTPTIEISERATFDSLLNFKIFSDELLITLTPKDSL